MVCGGPWVFVLLVHCDVCLRVCLRIQVLGGMGGWAG